MEQGSKNLATAESSGELLITNSRMQAAMARLAAAKLLVVCTQDWQETAEFLADAVLDEHSKNFHLPRAYASPLSETQTRVSGMFFLLVG